ncbi:glycosyltransferase [Pseudodesulfovibrio sp. zrk46]|uniref:glycosyltransferase family 4 protein n=1 Tax=Pseudodesulfovibrio sp. zrk46 TaxID=2725288 RepID=UPI001448CF3C|nr:glycosyltransferase [Pseudodesulfovibrio sp. zrk46]QJB56209.1 glycosyltransferase [Pseudodesulfovibrio sp. zrk46]
MKKILHVITGLDVGGAETMLYRLAKGMNRKRFTSRVVSLIEPGPMGTQLEEAGIPVHTLSMRRGVPSLPALLRLVRIIRNYKPDVVQSWLYHADLAALAATKIAYPMGGPKIAWNIRCSFMALDEYRRMTGVTLKLCAALSRFPDAILTNSNEARRFHKALGYTSKHFEVIPNGFNVDHFHPDPTARQAVREELSISPDKVVIGHVARFDAMKDHQTLIRAAAKTTQNCNTIFMLAGRGVDYDNLDIATWMREAGLPADRVRLLGERNDVARLMAAMDIHVSSSTGESFPNVVGEAMCCGVPNVVTDVGDSRILVADTGRVVGPGDADKMASALTELATMSNNGRELLGEAARQRIVAEYSLPSIINRYEKLYGDLCNGSL